MAQLPYPTVIAAGKGIGELMYRLGGSRRRIARINVDLCFPDMEPAARGRLVHASFRELGVSLVEAAMCWWKPRAKLRALRRIEGKEHLDEALRHGRGVILLSGHTTNLEIGASLIALEGPTQAVYKRVKNELFDAFTRWQRDKFAAGQVVERHDIRGMIRGLRQNLPLWYAPDQDFGLKRGVLAPFFGVPAATLTALSSLTRMSGARVVPFFPRRLPGDAGYLLTLSPALDNFPSGDDEQDARRVNHIIEEHVKLAPEQYIWAHR
ncbi:MAG: lipid A biosynthesis lauroyl acyltransferase, partial [Gammaproteobacteria bacterium]